MSLLQLSGVSKRFPGVVALQNVDFALEAGQVHALLGQNGAGKSTLLKIMTGAYPCDEGQIMLSGQEIRPSSPFDAVRLGISTVYQEVNLAPNLSVAENVCLGRESSGVVGIRWQEMHRRAERALQRVGIRLDVTSPLSVHSIAIQQMVAIARALDVDAKVLVLDEPTSSLDHAEVSHLFEAMKRLRAEGMGIVFVTHFLDQVYAIADTMTVLRNGKVAALSPVADMAKQDLVRIMIGRETGELVPSSAAHSAPTEELLRAEALGKQGSVSGVELVIQKGEILGFAGLLGSGRTEALRLLFGVDRPDSGGIAVDGTMHRSWTSRRAIQSGIALCPEDRKREAIVGELSIRENIALVLQSKRGWLRPISLKEQRRLADRLIQQLGIVASGPEQTVHTLSGGNQQKVILARWLAANPQLFLLDEPTRGIDVGAKAEIMSWMLQERDQGKSFVFVSAELPEVLAVSDRVTVFRERKMVGVQSGQNLTEDEVFRAIAEEPR